MTSQGRLQSCWIQITHTSFSWIGSGRYVVKRYARTPSRGSSSPNINTHILSSIWYPSSSNATCSPQHSTSPTARTYKPRMIRFIIYLTIQEGLQIHLNLVEVELVMLHLLRLHFLCYRLLTDRALCLDEIQDVFEIMCCQMLRLREVGEQTKPLLILKSWFQDLSML